MQHRFKWILASFLAINIISGCTGQMTSLGLSAEDKNDECDLLDRKLRKVDNFLEMVNAHSAFHLKERGAAIIVPSISRSSNKSRMLKDGKRNRTEVLKEQEKFGC